MRVRSAAETFGRVSPYLQAYGITRVARHTGLDRIGIPVWCAYTPNAKSIVVAQGKGVTDEDARISAVMEAIERAVACDPTLSREQASQAELSARGDAALALNGLLAAGKEPLPADEACDWMAGVDLVTGRKTYVPAEAVLLDRTIEDSRYWQSSDGLASGNTAEEAMFHALMERVERDAYALFQIMPQPARLARCVDPKCLGNADLDGMIAQISACDLQLTLFDMTSDLGLPCFAAYLGPSPRHLSAHARYVDVTHGAGAHPLAARAALRAVSEAAQSRLTFISGARDDVFPDTYRRALPESTRLALAAAPQPRSYEDTTPFADFAAIVAHLAACRIGPIIAVTLSGPHLPFAVVKMIVPGLENPEGLRRQRHGLRALQAALRT
ncbi:hypothetical protein BJF93_04190 [Xaviernesmea oryzae]|uniref:YcaO domain-containing protein n=1 Tax=Xaviernesmea oryzae TaxID=464029 RepID=A0A1Q9AV21_9HYPH|nr:YcaO-like family protein [Xaviernesmea oryzae]OLP59302.1 hypothetical protein BJF93_04190 [Xaviernesmea oryzae]SEK85586.1 ribosomal protein S12 methylthiotransferase accessory factor [Xaviernesmea oryzae]